MAARWAANRERVVVTEPGRASERGLTMIEALVMLAITAMVAALLYPMTARAMADAARGAAHGLNDAAAARGERVTRLLLRSAIAPQAAPGSAPVLSTIAGDPDAVAFDVALADAAGCARAGDDQTVTLLIANERDGGGALLCTVGRRETELWRWPQGQGQFAYSLDGVSWARQWRGRPASSRNGDVQTVLAPLVRFEVLAPGRNRQVWVERAGRTGPLEITDEQAEQAEPPTVRLVDRPDN